MFVGVESEITSTENGTNKNSTINMPLKLISVEIFSEATSVNI